jgi:hypothetical protein
MRQQFEQRLRVFKAKYVVGQKPLAELKNKQGALRSTPLLISNTTNVSEEELAKESKEERFQAAR